MKRFCFFVVVFTALAALAARAARAERDAAAESRLDQQSSKPINSGLLESVRNSNPTWDSTRYPTTGRSLLQSVQPTPNFEPPPPRFAWAERDVAADRPSPAWGLVGGSAWVVGSWAAGLVALCGLGFALSRATLRQVERSDRTLAISAGEHRLRRIYRFVLNAAGIYYYISLPVVMALVILVSAAVLYGFLAIGFLPIKLALILGIGALVTIWTMGRSLFLRVDARESGRALERSEAEGLWQLTEEVARTLDTRPIDEIRITGGTDLCVYERGSWREKMDNRAKRILVLGTAVLNGFKQEDFRCVLAHEYGHFSHRDTAGGDIALRVQNDMLKFYYTMVAAGQATWLNVAFHFLRLYHFIFRRISHGAARLQEVLADRVAAQAYGRSRSKAGCATSSARASPSARWRTARSAKPSRRSARSAISTIWRSRRRGPRTRPNSKRRSTARRLRTTRIPDRKTASA